MNPLIAGPIRATLVLGVAWLAMRLTRGRSASLRRHVLVVALFGALLTPFASAALPYARAVGLPAIPLDAIPLLDPGPDGEFPGLPLSNAASTLSRETALMEAAPSSVPWLQRLLPIAGMAWALGTFVLLVRMVTARFALRRLLRAARPAGVGFRRVLMGAEAAAGARAPVLISESVDVPLTARVLRPVIVLPAEAACWPEQRVALVMRHELAHVRQRDALAQLVAELACAVHFFNPLAWWARRRLEIERELAADERVMQGGLSASSYAAELLRVAAAHSGFHRVPGAALGAARKSGLSERVERLVTTGAHTLPSRTQSAAVIGLSSAVLLLVACASLERTGSTPANQGSVAGPAGVAAGDELSRAVARALGSSSSQLVLSIDRRIQGIAGEETARAIGEADANTATVIVIDPRSGSVLAMTNPRTATANYAPGSTLKMLLVAAALDEGKVAPEQIFDCGQGFREYEDGRRLRDWGAHGLLSVSQILARSSNVGASRIYDRMGGASSARWFSRFHLDQVLPIELESAVAGSAGSLRDEPAGSMRGAVAAMGQAVATSPLHMAALYAAVANDGVYLAPTLVLERWDAHGNVIWRHQPKPERLLRAETVRTTLQLLTGAVEDEHATGRAARLEGIPVAGKTGTAQVLPIGPSVREGDSPTYASFIGIVPASAPRYVILVGVEGGKPDTSGGKVAAPAFARIARRILAAH